MSEGLQSKASEGGPASSSSHRKTASKMDMNVFKQPDEIMFQAFQDGTINPKNLQKIPNPAKSETAAESSTHTRKRKFIEETMKPSKSARKEKDPELDREIAKEAPAAMLDNSRSPELSRKAFEIEWLHARDDEEVKKDMTAILQGEIIPQNVGADPDPRRQRYEDFVDSVKRLYDLSTLLPKKLHFKKLMISATNSDGKQFAWKVCADNWGRCKGLMDMKECRLQFSARYLKDGEKEWAGSRYSIPQSSKSSPEPSPAPSFFMRMETSPEPALGPSREQGKPLRTPTASLLSDASGYIPTFSGVGKSGVSGAGSQVTAGKKVEICKVSKCSRCGGTGHNKNNKKCPRFSERHASVDASGPEMNKTNETKAASTSDKKKTAADPTPTKITKREEQVAAPVIPTPALGFQDEESEEESGEVSSDSEIEWEN